MKLKTILIATLVIVLFSGCVSSISAPTSGPTASYTVEVENFAPKRSLVNIENVYFIVNTLDESWGGEQIIKNDNPTYVSTVPANKELTSIIKLMQGGGGFSSTCGAKFDLSLPANANLVAKLHFIRGKGTEVLGCSVRLYLDGKLFKTYEGGSNIIEYKVKWLY